MVPHPKATVFATSPDEASRGAISITADGVFAADISGIRSESVAALMYSIHGKDYEPGGVDQNILNGHEEVYVYTKTHGGWLFRFPDDIVQLLAAVLDSNFGAIAQRWSLIFENDGPPLPEAGEIEGMLRQVITIAQTAVSRHLSMYWLQEGC
jgi:hypothetical protein